MSTEFLANTVTAAIKIATTGNCPVMVQVAPKSYEVRTFDSVRNIYRASYTMDYHRARAYLTEARHAEALVAMGWDFDEATHEAGSDNSFGALRDRVKRSASKWTAA
jgi:hypothetical protein